MKSNWLRRLLSALSPHETAQGVGLSIAARNKWLDVIEKHGYTAHYYLPGIGKQNDRELWNALEELRMSGHIITDANGTLVGKVAKARLMPDEKAQERRASFKLID